MWTWPWFSLTSWTSMFFSWTQYCANITVNNILQAFRQHCASFLTLLQLCLYYLKKNLLRRKRKNRVVLNPYPCSEILQNILHNHKWRVHSCSSDTNYTTCKPDSWIRLQPWDLYLFTSPILPCGLQRSW